MTKLPAGKINGPRRRDQFHGHATIIGKRGSHDTEYWVTNNGYMTEKFAVRSVAFTEYDGDELVVRPVTSVRQKPEDPSNKHCTVQNIEAGDFIFEHVRRHTKDERSVYSVREDGPTGDLVLIKLPTSQEVELFNRLARKSKLAMTFLEGAYESYDALSDDNSSKLPDGLGWTEGLTEHMKNKLGRIKAFLRGIHDVELREKLLDYAKHTPARDMPTQWRTAEYVEKGHAIPVDSKSVWIMYRVDGSVTKLTPVGWEPMPIPMDALSLLKIDFSDDHNLKTLKWQLLRVKGATHISPSKHQQERQERTVMPVREKRHQERRRSNNRQPNRN